MRKVFSDGINIPTVIPFSNTIYNRNSICAMGNYIPHSTPFLPNYEKWKTFYLSDLESMFDNTASILESRYDIDLSLNDSDKIFEKFCIFIFNSSSKHIWKF